MSKIKQNEVLIGNLLKIEACRSTLREAVATSFEFGRRIPGSMRRRKACRISYSCMLCASCVTFASCARLWAAAARRSAGISCERTELGDVDLSDMSVVLQCVHETGAAFLGQSGLDFGPKSILKMVTSTRTPGNTPRG